jgi:uncharacterized protein (TIGR02996 family)
MSDEKALLATIWEHPNEDTPRLAYANWLQVSSNPADVARAEFIRAQCDLARMDEDDPRFRPRRAAANALLKAWGRTWRTQVRGAVRRWPWHRGFPQPDSRGISFDALLRMPRDELRVVPSLSLCVNNAAARFDELLAWPMLDRLDTFYLRDAVPEGDWVARALACRGFRNVCRVWLIDCPVKVADLEALLTGFRDRTIVSVVLNGSPIGNRGARMLLRHPVLATVRELEIGHIGMTADGAGALAASAYRPPKQDLHLRGNPLGDEGVRELLCWPGLERIKKLDLTDIGLGDTGTALLASTRPLRAVRKLWLNRNAIGADGAAALAASPHLRSITHLYLNENPLPPDSLRLLRDRFGSRLKSPPAPVR